MSPKTTVPPPWGTYALKGRNRLLRVLVNMGIARGPVRRAIQRAWKKQSGEAFDIHYYGLRLRLWPLDNITDQKILFRSGERDAVYLKHLARFAGPGAVFADIGANIGYYGLHALHIGFEHLIAIEPSPALLPRLRFHVEANQRESRTHLAPVAVADQSGTLYLHAPGEHGGASVSHEARSPNDVKVDVKTLAQVVTDAGAPYVTAFKIDIEGHEDRALLPWLRGLQDTQLPKCGILEICHSSQWKEDVMAYLATRGYKVVYQDKGNAVVERP